MKSVKQMLSLIKLIADPSQPLWLENKQGNTQGLLTVNIGQNVAVNSVKILTGDSSRRNPKTVK